VSISEVGQPVRPADGAEAGPGVAGDEAAGEAAEDVRGERGVRDPEVGLQEAGGAVLQAGGGDPGPRLQHPEGPDPFLPLPAGERGQEAAGTFETQADKRYQEEKKAEEI